MSTDRGKAFLESARSAYGQVLAFDHPTVSVSPFLNALDLSRQLATTDAEIDVICDSRGGLVVRWWLDVLDRERTQVRRAVFFGVHGLLHVGRPRADFGKGQKTPKASRMDFGTNPTVHHLNNFVQPEAIEFVEGMFRK